MKEFAGIDEAALGTVLKIYRKANRFTQQKIADYLGIDRSTYAKYETSRKPEIDVIMKLSVLYKISLDDFVRGFFDSEEKERSLPANSPKSSAPEFLSGEEQHLLALYRNSIRKSEIIKLAEKIHGEDTEIIDELKED